MWIAVAAAVAVGLLVISMYNALARLGVHADGAWSDIDVQLKRRHDLVPNLVETVKGYAAHERDVFEAVTRARSRAVVAKTVGERAEAEHELTVAMRSMMALSESYPVLQAAPNFLSLQNSLREIEEPLVGARRYYNAVVRDLNTKVVEFPSNVIAGMFGFRKREFFQLDSVEERSVPQVKFGAGQAPGAASGQKLLDPHIPSGDPERGPKA